MVVAVVVVAMQAGLPEEGGDKSELAADGMWSTLSANFTILRSLLNV